MSASKMVAPAAGEPAEPPGAIGVGIDFGTTYSSVVFIHSDKKRVVSVQYPNQLHYVERGQAPSVVTAYDLRTAPNIENPPSSQSQHPNWGFSAPATHQIFELFKLSLMPQQHLSDRFWRSPSVAKARNTLRARRVTAEEATEVFLRELWDFSLGEAAREFGMSVGQMRAAPLLVAMGIPANWSRDTVTALREAANNAGISGSHAHPAISFLPETEADLISFIADKAISTDFEVSPLFSAHSPLHTLKTYGPVSDNPQDGDIIGICDVGGGTIDTGTYMYMHEASTTAATPMFQECVAGDSQLAGTILLDDTFFTQVETKLRYQTTEKVRSLITRESIVQHFSEPWHSNLKRQFNGTGGFSILVPGFFMTWNQRKERRGPNYNPPRVSFTQQELRKLFDSAVDDVLHSFHDQTNAVVAAKGKLPRLLVLCGGFSGNPYLLSRVRECVDVLNRNQPQWVQGRIQVEHVSRAATRVLAVASGCAYHALGQRGLHEAARITSLPSEDSYFLTRDWNPTGIEKFLDKDDHLTLDIPRLVRFNLETINIRQHDNAIHLAVYRNLDETPRPTISPDKKHCVIRFKPSGVNKVWAGPEPGVIRIGIAYRPSGELQFLVRVGGEVLLEEVDIMIRAAEGNMAG